MSGRAAPALHAFVIGKPSLVAQFGERQRGPPKLWKDGAIRGYTALIDTANTNGTIAVIINITLERQTEDYLDRFEAAVRKHPESGNGA